MNLECQIMVGEIISSKKGQNFSFNTLSHTHGKYTFVIIHNNYFNFGANNTYFIIVIVLGTTGYEFVLQF
jgi:hypothetical protein